MTQSVLHHGERQAFPGHGLKNNKVVPQEGG